MRRDEVVKVWSEYLCSLAESLVTFAEALEEVESDEDFMQAYNALAQSGGVDVVDGVTVAGVDIDVLRDILTLEEHCALCGEPVEAVRTVGDWVWQCSSCGVVDPPLQE